MPFKASHYLSSILFPSSPLLFISVSPKRRLQKTDRHGRPSLCHIVKVIYVWLVKCSSVLYKCKIKPNHQIQMSTLITCHGNPDTWQVGVRRTHTRYNTIKKNTETSTDSSKEVGLEVNTEKTKYMLLSRHQNAGQNHDIKRANRCFENVVQFRYLGMTITNHNPI
jgi:hypothetical protein